MSIAIHVFNSIADGVDGTADTITVYELPKHGYFVGGNGEPLIFGSAEEANRSASLKLIMEFVDRTEARFIGWWTDEETGKVYVDGTTWHADYDEAERLCRERGEIAFWDIERQREFRPVVQG